MDDGERRPTGPRVIGKVIKSENVNAASSAEAVPMAAPAAPPSSGGGGGRPGPRVVNAEEYDAHAKAKEIIAEAQKKAEEIKAEAFRFKEDVFAKAREEAKADIQARSAEEIAKAKILAGEIIVDAQKDILELAVRCANKIIGKDLERDPEVLVDICAHVIESMRASKAMTLRVHPEDGRLLREKRPRLMELIARSVDIAVKDDAEVERGGCIIQTDYGVIDGQLKTQFEMLRQLLTPDTTKKESK